MPMNPASKLAIGNVVVFWVHDLMTSLDVELCRRRLELSLAPDIPTHIVLEVEGFRHMEPELLTEKLKFLEPFAPKLKRIAVIGGGVWLKSWIKVGGFPIAASVEYFDRSESEAAWQWVNE
jgi:hypothetical protein